MAPVARRLTLALLALTLPLAAAAQTSSRQRLDQSAGWGIDRSSGAVVVDASLLVLYDPAGKTLVVNPNYWNDALTETGGVVQRDGSWRMPDGNVVRPLLGTASIVLGDEPDGLVQAAGLPTIPYGKVDLVDGSGLVLADRSQVRTSGTSVKVPQALRPTTFALKVKHSHSCGGCRTWCNDGCHGADNIYPIGGKTGSCDFKLFHRCRQEFTPACRVDTYQCDGCVGTVIETYDAYLWQCTGGC